MASDIRALIDYYEKEKGLNHDDIVGALGSAFVAAYCRMLPGSERIRELHCEIDSKKGDVKVWANLEVSEDGEKFDPYNQVPLSKAVKIYPEAKLFDVLKFDVTPQKFGRVAIQSAKQTMRQYLRGVERELVFEEFKDRVGEVVSGSVRLFEGKDVIIDLGRFEGRMPMNERVFAEDYSVGDRIRVYIKDVQNLERGVDIILSRRSVSFVRCLFEAEVTELSDGTVEIKNIVRDPGYRTKIAVDSADSKVDPVGACVGLRGMRVKNIVREINNEKVDIIHFNDDITEFVAEALKPAKIIDCELDKENNVIYVSLGEEDLSKAIGKRGQNARLTSELIGWDLQIREDETEKEKFEERIAGVASDLSEILGLDKEQGDKLLRAGGISLDLVSQMSADYIAQVLDIDLAEGERVLQVAQKSESASLIPEQAKEQAKEQVKKEEKAGKEETENVS